MTIDYYALASNLRLFYNKENDTLRIIFISRMVYDYKIPRRNICSEMVSASKET